MMNGTEQLLLHRFHNAYVDIHKPLVILLCLGGVPAHVACIVTLSGKRLFRCVLMWTVSSSNDISAPLIAR